MSLGTSQTIPRPSPEQERLRTCEDLLGERRIVSATFEEPHPLCITITRVAQEGREQFLHISYVFQNTRNNFLLDNIGVLLESCVQIQKRGDLKNDSIREQIVANLPYIPPIEIPEHMLDAALKLFSMAVVKGGMQDSIGDLEFKEVANECACLAFSLGRFGVQNVAGFDDPLLQSVIREPGRESIKFFANYHLGLMSFYLERHSNQFLGSDAERAQLIWAHAYADTTLLDEALSNFADESEAVDVLYDAQEFGFSLGSQVHALPIWRRVSKLRPDDPSAHFEYGMTALRLAPLLDEGPKELVSAFQLGLNGHTVGRVGNFIAELYCNRGIDHQRLLGILNQLNRCPEAVRSQIYLTCADTLKDSHPDIREHVLQLDDCVRSLNN